MGFEPGENEKVVRKCETDGETWSVWPIIDDRNPVTDKTNRFDITWNSEEKINICLKTHGIPFTFAAIRDQKHR